MVLPRSLVKNMSTFASGINSQRKFKANNIVLSFIIAILLSLFSFHGLKIYNPLWVVLFLIYWHIRLDIKNFNTNLNYSFILGLICDFITGTTLGISSISYLIISFILSIFKAKIYFYTMLQIFLMVSSLLIINQVIFLIYYMASGVLNNITLMHSFAPVITSLLVWPILGFILDRFSLNTR